MPSRQHAASRDDAAASTETVEFVVGGMTCGSCAARVQRVLAKTDGVANAEVNLATSRARVRLARRVESAELQSRVARIGYSLAPVVDQRRQAGEGSEAAVRRAWGYRVVAAAPAALFALATMVRPALMTAPGWRLPGDRVAGATLNAGGVLTVRATAVGADAALAQIVRLVERAQAGKGQAQRLADRISAVFVPAVIAVAALTFAGWWLLGADPVAGLTAAVAVLIIACPCALGLATPTAIMVGTGRGAELGVLMKSVEVLERTRRITTVVFDKTGTLTRGRMAVTDAVPGHGTTSDELLRLAGAAEAGSEHPIGAAVAAAAHQRGELPPAQGFRALAGQGVQADIQVAPGAPAVTVWVGGASWPLRPGCWCQAPCRTPPSGWSARARPWCGPAGRARSAGCWPWPTPSRTAPASRSGASTRWAWRSPC